MIFDITGHCFCKGKVQTKTEIRDFLLWKNSGNVVANYQQMLCQTACSVVANYTKAFLISPGTVFAREKSKPKLKLGIFCFGKIPVML